MDNYRIIAMHLAQIYHILNTEYSYLFKEEKALLKACGVIYTLEYLRKGLITIESIDNAIFIASIGRCALPLAKKTHEKKKGITEVGLFFGVHEVENLLLNFILQLECLIFHAEHFLNVRDDAIIRRVLSKKNAIKKTIDKTLKQARKEGIDHNLNDLVVTFMTESNFNELRKEIGVIKKDEREEFSQIENGTNLLVDNEEKAELGIDHLFGLGAGDHMLGNVELAEVITWGNGTYIGNLEKDIPRGKGIWTGLDGDIYDGQFNEGLKHGYGKFTWSTGEVYEGDWKNDKRHGKGKYTWADGSFYEGEWIEDQFGGHGVWKHHEGDYHKGQWKNGKRHGLGVYTYADGNKLEGTWENGIYTDQNIKASDIIKWGGGENLCGDDMHVYTNEGIYKNIKVHFFSSTLFGECIEYYYIEGDVRKFNTEDELIKGVEESGGRIFGEKDILLLVHEIEEAHFKEFWYDSELLERASQFKDSRVAKALTIRHHFLQDKYAGSCYVLRHTIKAIESPYFKTLWEMLKSSNILESQAASFILGEIGGLWVFNKIIQILNVPGEKTYSHILPCLVHLIGRYYEIIEEKEPTMEVIDVNTGHMRTESMRDSMPDIFERTMNDRAKANELFKMPSEDDINDMTSILQKIPFVAFTNINIEKEKFIKTVEVLRKQTGNGY